MLLRNGSCVEQVWGALNAAYPGTHAEFVVVSSEEVKYFQRYFLCLDGL